MSQSTQSVQGHKFNTYPGQSASVMHALIWTRWLLVMLASSAAAHHASHVETRSKSDSSNMGASLIDGVANNTLFCEVEPHLALRLADFRGPTPSVTLSHDEYVKLVERLVAVKDGLGQYAMYGTFTTSYRFYEPLVKTILRNLDQLNAAYSEWTARAGTSENFPLVTKAAIACVSQNTATLKKLIQDLHPIKVNMVLSLSDELLDADWFSGVFRFMANKTFFDDAVIVVNFLFDVARTEDHRQRLWNLYFQHCSPWCCIPLPISGPVTNHLSSSDGESIVDRILSLFDSSTLNREKDFHPPARFDSAWLLQLGLLFHHDHVTPEVTLELAQAMARTFGPGRIETDEHIVSFLRLVFVDFNPYRPLKAGLMTSTAPVLAASEKWRPVVVSLWNLTVGKSQTCVSSIVEQCGDACSHLERHFPDIVSELDTDFCPGYMDAPTTPDVIARCNILKVDLSSDKRIRAAEAFIRHNLSDKLLDRHTELRIARAVRSAMCGVLNRHIEAIVGRTVTPTVALQSLCTCVAEKLIYMQSDHLLAPQVVTEHEVTYMIRFLFLVPDASLSKMVLRPFLQRIRSIPLAEHLFTVLLEELKGNPDHFLLHYAIKLGELVPVDYARAFVAKLAVIVYSHARDNGALPADFLNFMDAQRQDHLLDPSFFHDLLSLLQSLPLSAICANSECVSFLENVTSSIISAHNAQDNHDTEPLTAIAPDACIQRVLQLFSQRAGIVASLARGPLTDEFSTAIYYVFSLIYENASAKFTIVPANQLLKSNFSTPKRAALTVDDMTVQLIETFLSLHHTGASESDLVAVLNWICKLPRDQDADCVGDEKRALYVVSYYALVIMLVRTRPDLLSFPVARKFVESHEVTLLLHLHHAHTIYRAIVDPALRLHLLPIVIQSFQVGEDSKMFIVLDKDVFQGIADADRDAFVKSFITAAFQETGRSRAHVELLPFWIKHGLVSPANLEYMLDSLKREGKIGTHVMSFLVIRAVFSNADLTSFQSATLDACLNPDGLAPENGGRSNSAYSHVFLLSALCKYASFESWLVRQSATVIDNVRALTGSDQHHIAHIAHIAHSEIAAAIVSYRRAINELHQWEMPWKRKKALFYAIIEKLAILLAECDPCNYCHCEETLQLLNDFVEASLLVIILAVLDNTSSSSALVLNEHHIKILLTAVTLFIRSHRARREFVRYVCVLGAGSFKTDSVMESVLMLTNQRFSFIGMDELVLLGMTRDSEESCVFVSELIEKLFAPCAEEHDFSLVSDLFFSTPNCIDPIVFDFISAAYSGNFLSDDSFTHFLQLTNAQPQLISKSSRFLSILLIPISLHEEYEKSKRGGNRDQDIFSAKGALSQFSTETLLLIEKRLDLFCHFYSHSRETIVKLWRILNVHAEGIIKRSPVLTNLHHFMSADSNLIPQEFDSSALSVDCILSLTAALVNSDCASNDRQTILIQAISMIPSSLTLETLYESSNVAWIQTAQKMASQLVNVGVGGIERVDLITERFVDGWLVIFDFAPKKTHETLIPFLIRLLRKCSATVCLHFAMQLDSPILRPFLIAQLQSGRLFALLLDIYRVGWIECDTYAAPMRRVLYTSVLLALPADGDYTSQAARDAAVKQLQDCAENKNIPEMASVLVDIIKHIPVMQRDANEVDMSRLIDTVIAALIAVSDAHEDSRHPELVTLFMRFISLVKIELLVLCQQSQIKALALFIHRHSSSDSGDILVVLEGLVLRADANTACAILDGFSANFRADTCALPESLPRSLLKANVASIHHFLKVYMERLRELTASSVNASNRVHLVKGHMLPTLRYLSVCAPPAAIVALWIDLFGTTVASHFHNLCFAQCLLALLTANVDIRALFSPLFMTEQLLSQVSKLDCGSAKAPLHEALVLIADSDMDALKKLPRSCRPVIEQMRLGDNFTAALNIAKSSIDRFSTTISKLYEKVTLEFKASLKTTNYPNHCSLTDDIFELFTSAIKLFDFIQTKNYLIIVDETLLRKFLYAVDQGCSLMGAAVNMQNPSPRDMILAKAMALFFRLLLRNNVLSIRSIQAYAAVVPYNAAHVAVLECFTVESDLSTLFDMVVDANMEGSALPISSVVIGLLKMWVKLSHHIEPEDWKDWRFVQHVIGLGPTKIGQFIDNIIPLIGSDQFSGELLLQNVLALAIKTFHRRPDVCGDALPIIQALLDKLVSVNALTATQRIIATRALFRK